MAKPHTAKRQKPIRVFIVDDSFVKQEGYKAMLDTNPDKDIVLVGMADRNTPDLPSQVLAARADVVIVDGVLQKSTYYKQIEGTPEINGINACQAIRKKLGSSVKIILCTNWAPLRKEFPRSGADEFVNEGLTNDALRNLIRNVYAGSRSQQDRAPQFTSLNLNVRAKQISIGTDLLSEPIVVTLRSSLFAFLHYLAQERLHDGEQWVKEISSGKYKFSEATQWKNIAIHDGNTHQSCEISSEVLANWRTLINAAVETMVNPVPKLVFGPNPGRRADREDNERTYYLNPSIRQIEIQDLRNAE